MAQAQKRTINVGEKYCLGMYVATSTDKNIRSLDGELREWQEGESGAEVKYMWHFTIPEGCRQATKISQISAHADESAFMLVPYSAVLDREKRQQRSRPG